MSLGALPPLKTVLANHGLLADKRLGQHFLLDPAILARIARAGGDLNSAHIVEIGPGPGGLTRALLQMGAEQVTAIELDRRFLPVLDSLVAASDGRLSVRHADALHVDIAGLTPSPLTVVANLPYNVATPLLLRWLARIERFAKLVVLVQKEVAQRLTAPAGAKDYGRLAVRAQMVTTPRLLFDVKPGSFVPPPNVMSSVVELVPRPVPLVACPMATLERVTQAAFGQRRKMLRTSLKSLTPDPLPLLDAVGLDPALRAENVTVEQFGCLAQVFADGKTRDTKG